MAEPDSFSETLQGLGGAGLHPRTNDPKFVMQYTRVRDMGTNVASFGQDLTEMSSKTRAIDITEFSFGVIGGGLNVAHRAVRDHAADALKQGKEVLESWRTAINTAADNGETADKASKPPKPKDDEFKLPGGGMKPMGGAGDLPSGLGPGGMDPLDGLKKPDDLNKDALDGLDKDALDGLDKDALDGLDKDGLDDIKKPDDGLKPDDLDDLERPGPDMPDRPDMNLPQQPDPGGGNPPDLNGLNQPTGTDLAGADPRVPGLPNSGLPNAGLPNLSGGPDPRAAMPRTGSGFPEGFSSGMSSGGSGGLPGGPGSIARALNTGMPLYPPPMGGGAAPSRDEQDREKGPLLPEDEGVWGDDEDIAPAVIGGEG